MTDPSTRLMELDARHTELLERLDQLDNELVGVLEEWTRGQRENGEWRAESGQLTVDN